MDKFQEMRAFAAVVDAGSFVKAAESLELSKTVVSRLVNDLESRLGARLLHRTTRKLSLTEEGTVFYERCQELLGGLDAAEAEITAHAGEAIGLLRANVPVSFGLVYLSQLWPVFLQHHPKLSVDVTLSDRVVDLVEEGYDLAVRIAQLPSSSLISRKLASTRLILCASPEYLQRQGVPTHPTQISSHDVITYTLLAMGEHWLFEGPGGSVTVKVSPRMRSNSGDTCCAAARQGRGLVLQPSFLVANDLRSGALVEVLPEYRSIELGVYVVYPSRRHLLPKVRAAIEFLADAFKQPAWAD